MQWRATLTRRSRKGGARTGCARYRLPSRAGFAGVGTWRDGGLNVSACGAAIVSQPKAGLR